jgi:ADP-ribose pyrophosphatase YjhB (NUDIX family)
MIKYPVVAVVVILRYKDRVLLLRHGNGALKFPGGKMRLGESILGTLRRELKEELDYFLSKDPELFSIFNYVSKDKKEHAVFLDFIYPLSKRPKLLSPEGLEVLWLNKEEILLNNITQNREFLKKIFNYKRRSRKSGSRGRPKSDLLLV